MKQPITIPVKTGHRPSATIRLAAKLGYTLAETRKFIRGGGLRRQNDEQ